MILGLKYSRKSLELAKRPGLFFWFLSLLICTNTNIAKATEPINKAKAVVQTISKTTTTTSVASKKTHPQVIDFSAVWCGPCRKFAPTFDRLAAKYKGRVDFIHADVDNPQFKKLVSYYQIRVVPTVVFREATGKTTFVSQGVPDEATVIKQTDKLLNQ